ncbi:MAG: stage V sporulation protein AD [Clostridiales bacterium]|jgi:stage V sporulation protein AD|nr:stage V sporulation protein AD [Clostridiales bacterium]
MILKKRVGSQTVEIKSKISIVSGGTVAGKKESEGPFKDFFDIRLENAEWEQKTWEKTESKMQKEAALKAIEKSHILLEEINYIFGGDLLNQCISSSYAMRELNIPFFGLYGACSTIIEGLSLASMIIDGGFAENILAISSSHFCTAERQYRTPLEYGGQRTPTSQWTVTGSGAMILSSTGNGPYVTHITTGKIIDYGVKDPNNMGAAMAPAACDTLKRHFKDTKRKPEFYDIILSGDLGIVGKEMVCDILEKEGYNLSKNYEDAGCLIFDIKKQGVFAGGSGCGCMAIMFCGWMLKQLLKKNFKNVLVMATGALMSPTSSLQGETIPGIAHAVSISTV